MEAERRDARDDEDPDDVDDTVDMVDTGDIVLARPLLKELNPESLLLWAWLEAEPPFSFRHTSVV